MTTLQSQLPDTADHLRQARQSVPDDFKRNDGSWLKPRCLGCAASLDCCMVLITEDDPQKPVITTICSECQQLTTAFWSRYEECPTITTRLSPSKNIESWYQKGVFRRWRFDIWSKGQAEGSPRSGSTEATNRLSGFLKD